MRGVTATTVSALFLRHFANLVTQPGGIFQHVSLQYLNASHRKAESLSGQ